MPLDGSVVAALRHELEQYALDSRIDKIYQPESDELVLTLRNRGEQRRLLISAHNQYPRAHFTTLARSNPAQPPVFCMLLRKHLSGGRIIHIEQPDFERMLIFHVQGLDELNQITHKKLIIEMMGKHSNIILVDTHSGLILDAIKRVPLHISRKRQVLPGLAYEMPPMSKINPLTLSDAIDLNDCFSHSDNQPLKSTLINTFNGLSPLMASEILVRSGIDHSQHWSELSHAEKKSFKNVFLEVTHLISQADFSPALYQDTVTGRMIDFSVIPIQHLNALDSIPADSTSQLLERFYGLKDHQERLTQRSSDLRKMLTLKRNRHTHKLQNLHQDETNALKATQDKIKADLLMAGLHEIEAGQSTYQTVNYYDDAQPTIDIQLDSRKTPAQNAQRLYKRYHKAKTALVEIKRQREKTQQEIQYLDQLFHSLDQADSLADLEVIRQELVDAGYLKKRLSRGKKPKPPAESQPLKYTSSQGHTILVGKNNLQNEMVTFRIGKKNDLWFHVKDLPGSHVVLILEQQQPSDDEIREAALLAAYYSKGRQSGKLPVDYTWCRHVKKQRGAQPGMVIYEQHQTIYVTPSESGINNLLENNLKNSR
ncbi:Rqc2 family fibronectin-binding protein [Anoxynatronum buryatiense]|uniref:Rqc2 homolog RqcH n=1 Tax=Anoxynatronum buryatiense TaxID=489973 RepID=A0AA45WU83_9CLOT|nr:NFACT RNA binding domain-containing protein [Anoxynatronum buryatiense]SMP46828.1 Predicted component of the ribosome quality control (RQC) complex, YloA/Tae2 family, contains fibronectin-binding (FbpA) and DUF814 domains [Anoxynatronum buryatiense]